MKKKLLSILLVLAFAVGMITPAFAFAQTQSLEGSTLITQLDDAYQVIITQDYFIGKTQNTVKLSYEGLLDDVESIDTHLGVFLLPDEDSFYSQQITFTKLPDTGKTYFFVDGPIWKNEDTSYADYSYADGYFGYNKAKGALTWILNEGGLCDAYYVIHENTPRDYNVASSFYGVEKGVPSAKYYQLMSADITYWFTGGYLVLTPSIADEILATGCYKTKMYDMTSDSEVDVVYEIDKLFPDVKQMILNARAGKAPRLAGDNSSKADAPSAWAKSYVDDAIAAGLVPASLQSKYTAAATRAEFCALAVALFEAATGEESADRVKFSDTSDVNVEKMAALGVVNGIGGGKFAPDNKLTREQAATMLSRLAKVMGKPLTAGAPTFADNAGVSDWAVDAVGQMQATGVMGGVGDNKFAPGSDYTREQCIITIMRMFELMK